MSYEKERPFFLNTAFKWNEYMKKIKNQEDFEEFHARLWKSCLENEINLKNYWYLLRKFALDVISYKQNIDVLSFQQMLLTVLEQTDYISQQISVILQDINNIISTKT